MPDDRKFLTIVAAAVFLIVAAIALYHDPYRFYLLKSDADLIYAYEALLVNDGRAQDYHDHTGYLYIVLLSVWIDFWQVLGIIPVAALSEVPPPGQSEPLTRLLVGNMSYRTGIQHIDIWVFIRRYQMITGAGKLPG